MYIEYTPSTTRGWYTCSSVNVVGRTGCYNRIVCIIHVFTFTRTCTSKSRGIHTCIAACMLLKGTSSSIFLVHTQGSELFPMDRLNRCLRRIWGPRRRHVRRPRCLLCGRVCRVRARRVRRTCPCRRSSGPGLLPHSHRQEDARQDLR